MPSSIQQKGIASAVERKPLQLQGVDHVFNICCRPKYLQSYKDCLKISDSVRCSTIFPKIQGLLERIFWVDPGALVRRHFAGIKRTQSQNSVWRFENNESILVGDLRAQRSIMSTILQKQQARIVSWLVEIYQSCIWLKYVPCPWHERAWGLCRIILKVLECDLDINLKTTIERHLSKFQHAHFKNKFTKTAFYEVISTVEWRLYYNIF